MYVCMYIYIYIYTYTHTHIYIYIYIHVYICVIISHTHVLSAAYRLCLLGLLMVRGATSVEHSSRYNIPT